MNRPEIALLMSTYERPAHLRRALESIALQEGVDGRMELVVTDDGSTDETPRIVEEFAGRVPFRVGFTTHEHTTFRLSRCRNEGAAASTAPYLLFLDGDCVLPRDHVAVHLAKRREGTVMAGDFCRLDQETSDRVTVETIRSGEFPKWAPQSELKRLKKLDRSARFYRLIHHPTKPKIIGNNVGIWREDYQRVNGYDENFQGWGCEDDDLRHRLRRSGVGVASILRWTHTYHLWHPTDTTAPAHWKEGANVAYLLRKGGLTRCRNGLVKRGVDDLSVRVVGKPACAHPVVELVARRFSRLPVERPEVEILLLPGDGRFSGHADCNVLVALEPEAARSRAARHAHLLVGPAGGVDSTRPHFALDQFEQALAAVA
ncbi:MAG: glycosyltransferase [Planctomycetota bacterium]|nr:MAG: glycosyltransferase [Planctomycetota bacterium]